MSLNKWIQVFIATLKDFQKNVSRARRGIIYVSRAEFEAHVEDYRNGRDRI